jgi:hypothetical protein
VAGDSRLFLHGKYNSSYYTPSIVTPKSSGFGFGLKPSAYSTTSYKYASISFFRLECDYNKFAKKEVERENYRKEREK